jgi:pimeloyl-ACP methyl ester carboxylesterase
VGAPRPKAVELRIGSDRIQLWRAGKGRPLILYHGAFLSSILWSRVIPLLARSFEVWAVDLPGHGRSDGGTTDLTGFTSRLVNRLGFGRAHFAGSSFGGGVLIRFAAEHPDRVDRLVLVSPTGIPAVENDAVVRTYPKPRSLFEAFRRAIHDPALATRALFREVGKLQSRAAPFIARYRASLPKGYRERGWIPEMKAIRCPTMVVWGNEDRIVPFVFAERLTAYIQGAVLHVMQGTGHFPYFERPGEFARIIRLFLRGGGISSRRGSSGRGSSERNRRSSGDSG